MRASPSKVKDQFQLPTSFDAAMNSKCNFTRLTCLVTLTLGGNSMSVMSLSLVRGEKDCHSSEVVIDCMTAQLFS
jgi:hypothetical protein